MERTFGNEAPTPPMAACTQGAAIHSKAAEPGSLNKGVQKVDDPIW